MESVIPSHLDLQKALNERLRVIEPFIHQAPADRRLGLKIRFWQRPAIAVSIVLLGLNAGIFFALGMLMQMSPTWSEQLPASDQCMFIWLSSFIFPVSALFFRWMHVSQLKYLARVSKRKAFAAISYAEACAAEINSIKAQVRAFVKHQEGTGTYGSLPDISPREPANEEIALRGWEAALTQHVRGFLTRFDEACRPDHALIASLSKTPALPAQAETALAG